jgi:GDP-mannose 6-dehydrogenase
MKISVFGLGNVGAVSAACLADRGHAVIGIDTEPRKIDLLRGGRSPIHENGLDGLIGRTVGCGRLAATTDAAEAIMATDMSLVCVGTPSGADGSVDLAAVETVTAEIGSAIRSKSSRHVVVVRSTVPPGTTRNTIAARLAQASGKRPGEGFGIAFNPEFLRAGSGIEDFNNPAKTIVGAFDQRTAEEVMALYEGTSGPRIVTRIETAEFVKYVDNAWHALKVVFANEIGLIGKALGTDSRDVMSIFSQDRHLNISPAYLNPGFAFGGSCLPKDLRALIGLARKHGVSLPVLDHVTDSNRMLIERSVDWILGHGRKRIAFLGITFKAGTDDLRESPFVVLIAQLIESGCDVRIVDPHVGLAQLFGANRQYLFEQLPQISALLSADDDDVLRWAEVIVVTASDPRYAALVARHGDGRIVLDLSVEGRGGANGSAKGLLW